MRHFRLAPLAPLLFGLAACATTGENADLPGGGGATVDVQIDVPAADALDAGVEASPDAQAEASVDADAAEDGDAADAATDAASDAASDATADAASDAAIDQGAGDAAIDQGAGDATTDVTTEAAPPPHLSALSPDTGAAGQAFTLTVTGSGFDPAATVEVGGTAVPTTWVDDATLTADVPASAVPGAGAYAVTVRNVAADPTSESNAAYYLATSAGGGPVVVDWEPDNGLPGETVLVVGSNLVGSTLTLTDPNGMTATGGATGSVSWWGGSYQTVAFTIPSGWASGPIRASNAGGSYLGRRFNVGQNLSRLATTTASASSFYSSTWPVAKGWDNRLATSWFSAIGDCASLSSCTSVPWYQLDFGAETTVGRIAMRGNREYESGWDFFRGRFEVLDANGAVLWAASYDLPAPDRDVDVVIQPVISGARAVKFTSEADQSNEPGFAELEAFAD